MKDVRFFSGHEGNLLTANSECPEFCSFEQALALFVAATTAAAAGVCVFVRFL